MSQTGAPSCALPPLMRAGAKVVAKARAEEKVGVFVRRGGRLQVVEYSEMRPEDSSAAEAGVHLSMPVSAPDRLRPISDLLRQIAFGHFWADTCSHEHTTLPLVPGRMLLFSRPESRALVWTSQSRVQAQAS